MPRFRVSTHFGREFTDGRHRFEHWYRDNTVYFITARCRDRYPAFDSEETKAVFWDRFDHWTRHYGFVPWVTTLLNNHYHTLGYLKVGENLGPMMQRFHGSVAKLVNDLLPERRTPFWKEKGRNDYFDGCIRDEKQCRKAYRYTLTQSTRHRLCSDHRKYPHTRARIELERGLRRALELRAFLDDVPYPRYGQATRGSD
jgi:REP element-mobilizing transposase RayT